MKPRLILFCLFVAVALAFGATRWFRRFRAAADFRRAAEAGQWRLLVGDPYTGLTMWNAATWEEHRVRDFGEAWSGLIDFDIAPELKELVVTRDDNRADPISLERTRPHHPRLDVRRAYAGSTVACVRRLQNGEIFYLEGTDGAVPGNLRRLGPSANDGHDHPEEDPIVELPVQIARNLCFDMTDDGAHIAWLGTDGQLHTAERAGEKIANLQTWTAPLTAVRRDMQLSPDGESLVIATGGAVERIDLASGARTTVLEDRGVLSLLAVSPDSRFALVELYQSGPGWQTLSLASLRNGQWGVRLGDGAEFPLGIPDRSYEPSMRWVPPADTLKRP